MLVLPQLRSIHIFQRKGVLIAGGLSKGGDMREFAETISNFVIPLF